jgi:hypothetical protein
VRPCGDPGFVGVHAFSVRRKSNFRTSVVGQVANLPAQPKNPNPTAGWQPAPRNSFFHRSLACGRAAIPSIVGVHALACGRAAIRSIVGVHALACSRAAIISRTPAARLFGHQGRRGLAPFVLSTRRGRRGKRRVPPFPPVQRGPSPPPPCPPAGGCRFRAQSCHFAPTGEGPFRKIYRGVDRI